MKLKIITLAIFISSIYSSQTLTVQDRNDAGAPSTQSGFFQANTPVNFPSGASGWWHLLDLRHIDPANNHAMQFAGSYTDQNLWFRKIARGDVQSSDTSPWSKFLLENPQGKTAIGGNADWEKLTLTGGHEDTTFLMHSANGSHPHAHLTLWASEPAVTWTGVGIGNNIRNFHNSQSFTRIETTKGGSYIRLLENEINFNLVSGAGVKQQSLTLYGNGNAALQGKLETKEVKVTQTPTADFVFEEDYDLPNLEDVERHIREKKHLPEIASAKEMEREGVNVGEFQIKLLQKIEELTLYSIEQNKQIKSQLEKIKSLELENQQIKTLIQRIENLENSSEKLNKK